MKYLVIGAGGQLGRDVVPRLGGQVIEAGRELADLTNPGSLKKLLEDVAPAVVVNCAAYNFVDRAESEPHEALAVNALGTRNLARLCGERGCLLVHFSTDYVFGQDDDRRSPYRETDAPGPVNVYGVSKLAGECFVRALCPAHCIVRSCGLYGFRGTGGKGGNFVETMLKLAQRNERVRVVTDEICTPTSTADLADATIALLSAGQTGLYHITNSGQCSRFEFARETFRLAGLDIEVLPITSREFGAAARRPAYSVLAMSGIEELGLARPRSWQEALADYIRQRPGRN
jgi:dTDP-4-dehydrorhamnose reductase